MSMKEEEKPKAEEDAEMKVVDSMNPSIPED